MAEKICVKPVEGATVSSKKIEAVVNKKDGISGGKTGAKLVNDLSAKIKKDLSSGGKTIEKALKR